MSDEIQTLAGLVDSIASLGILSLALFRVALMSKRFVDPIFKSKARWSAALFAVILLSNATDLIPSSSNLLLSTLDFLPFPALLFIIFAFVDRTIILAGRMDFFHRDALSWSRLRLTLAGILVVGVVLILLPSGYPTESAVPWWIVDLLDLSIVLIVFVFGFAASALVVSARRSADRTLRRHILLLGTSLAMFVVMVGLFVFPTTDLQVVVTDAISVGSLVVLYFAAMSLTPLGHVERLEA